MNPIRETHREAMEFSDLALIAKARGDMTEFLELSKKALVLETEAANMLRFNFEIEPTRSVLYRSAASIAIDCKNYTEAIKLIELGLGGNPPQEIADELRELLKQAHLEQPATVR